MSHSQKERLDTFNADGTKTGRIIQRGQQLQANEYILGVQVWIRNPTRHYLIQQRPASRSLPNMWTTTAGHVGTGESPLRAIVRELQEEIGLAIPSDQLKFAGSQLGKRYISKFWLVELNPDLSELTLQVEEVASIRWASQSEIERMVENGRFFNYGTQYLNTIFNF